MTVKTPYLQAVQAQARNLVDSATTVRRSLASLDLAAWSSGTIAVVGMGASYHAAHALVEHLRPAGRAAFALSASELLDDPPVLADHHLVVSESGQSRETLVAVQRLAGRSVLALTNDPGSPVAQAAPAHVELGCMPDSPVYTVGYTATLQAFGLLAEGLGVPAGDPGWEAVPRLVDALLADSAPVDAFAARLDGVRSVDVVGDAAGFATATEAALLLREATRVPATATRTYEYLHGPMEPLQEGQACIVAGDGREVELARFAAGTGAAVLLLTAGDVEPAPQLSVVRVPAAAPLQRAVLEMLPLQLLVRGLATRRGLAIDGFRYHQDDTKLVPPGR